MDENQIRQLVEGVKQGDQASFEMLYMVSSRAVYFICVSFLGNEEDAKDVVQEVYVTAYEKIYQLNDGGKFVPWINQIAVNKCKKVLLKKTLSFVDVEDMDSRLTEENENFLPEEYITQKEKRKLVMDIMRNTLSDVQYKTVILYYFNGLTIDEIADIMECPPGTVKARLSLSRAKIRNGVQAYENGSGDKLYSVVGLPLLMRLLYEEANSMIVPDMLPEIIGTIMSRFAAGSMSAYGVGAAGEAVGNAVGAVAENAVGNIVGTAAGNTGKAVAGGMLKTGIGALKVKIAIGAVVAAVVGVGAFVLIKNSKSDEASDSKTATDMLEHSVDTEIADTEEPTADTKEETTEFSGDWDTTEEYGYSPFWLKYANLGALEEKDLSDVMFYDKFTFGTELKDMFASYNYYWFNTFLGEHIETNSLNDVMNYSDELISPGKYWTIWLYEEKDNYDHYIKIDVYNLTDSPLTLGECIENNQFVYESDLEHEGYEVLNVEYKKNEIRTGLPLVMDLLGKPTKVYAERNFTNFSDREGQDEEFADTVQKGGGQIYYNLLYDKGEYMLDINVSEANTGNAYIGMCSVMYFTKGVYEYDKTILGLYDQYPEYDFE
ncbi:MAG: sigma-70 family RNA polymerase sigma factor [Lachnospiraceae bacterium]|nr:sigma-70 family RNA polymerase sigma factor [Lachnospiraceae bacterium]